MRRRAEEVAAPLILLPRSAAPFLDGIGRVGEAFGADGPAEYYENFVTGFWLRGTSPAQVFGRPVGLAVAADGSLLIADDTSQTIWRVSYDPD